MCKVQYLQRCLKFLVLHKKYFKYLTKLTVVSRKKTKLRPSILYSMNVMCCKFFSWNRIKALNGQQINRLQLWLMINSLELVND